MDRIAYECVKKEIRSKDKGQRVTFIGRQRGEKEVYLKLIRSLETIRDVQVTLPPRKDPIPTVQEARWAPCPSGRARKISRPTDFDSRTVHPAASRYSDYATTAAEI